MGFQFRENTSHLPARLPSQGRKLRSSSGNDAIQNPVDRYYKIVTDQLLVSLHGKAGVLFAKKDGDQHDERAGGNCQPQ
jgi:hypothetical protein